MALSGISRLGPVPLRLTVASVFIYTGYGKLFGSDIQRFVDFVRTLDLPHPELLAHVAAWGEFAGGILLALGFATRLAAAVNATTMAVAVWKVKLGGDVLAHWKNFAGPDGYDFPLVLLGACLALLFLGAGTLSVDALLAPKGEDD